jgi:adenine-specific DNA-methyltransferase
VARINELISRVADSNPQLAEDIKREYDAVAGRLAFGLNFERHTPEAVELPGRPVRAGDKVHILPPRGETVKAENKVIWFVESIDKSASPKIAHLVRQINDEEIAEADVAVEDLVVVAEFRDPIYPGLVSTGKVERGGDKPFHMVINAENFHALEALMFTHRGKVDAIYIDPPYNTGAKDWKYNNDYVESEDMYRHSKWLAFMERRLLLAKELLNPEGSVLIVTIDEKEYLRLGLLLEQTFPEAEIQMVSSVINPRAGVARLKAFTRVDEYIFFIMIGDAGVTASAMSGDVTDQPVTAPIWFSLMRTGNNSARSDSPNLFYPVWVDALRNVHSVGNGLPLGMDRNDVEPPEAGLVAIWPLRPNGSENTWQLGAPTLRKALEDGTARIGNSGGRNTISYLRNAEKVRIQNGEIEILGREPDGSLILRHAEGAKRKIRPKTVWNNPAHDAGLYGSQLVRTILPERRFPFPKSLYVVEDSLRSILINKPAATVVDFFSGSGTTAHAVMRLNKQDGGNRLSISVTNNEVSADEQKDLRARKLRPGDSEWEKWGICDYITKPRIKAAVTGQTPDGEPIQGVYKFTDEFPMSEGFEENVEFFTLTYESPGRVAANLAFDRISPLLWIRAGSRGPRIESVENGFAVTEAYGVLADLDKTSDFISSISKKPEATHAFIVTDEDRLFEAVARELPGHIEPVRLYDAYIRNFEIDAMRVTR